MIRGIFNLFIASGKQLHQEQRDEVICTSMKGFLLTKIENFKTYSHQNSNKTLTVIARIKAQKIKLKVLTSVLAQTLSSIGFQ